jgi:DNA invertase Pin-like site-specific DNA recombinase
MYIGLMTTAILYTRVSTTDQMENGASLAAQESTLRAMAERRGWDVVVKREEGRSAKNMNRPELQEALRMLDRGEAHVLVAVRLDRVSRSVRDFATLLDRAQRRGWGIAFSETDIDTTTPGGMLTVHVLSAAAQFERALISVRTKEGMAQKAKEGQTFGREVAADFLPVYRRVLDLHAAGASLNGIAATLNVEGVATAKGGKWYASTVRAIVTSKTAQAL